MGQRVRTARFNGGDSKLRRPKGCWKDQKQSIEWIAVFGEPQMEAAEFRASFQKNSCFGGKSEGDGEGEGFSGGDKGIRASDGGEAKEGVDRAD